MGPSVKRDKYIKGVLLAMSYDIAHHMNSFADNLIKIARVKYRWANIEDFGVPRG